MALFDLLVVDDDRVNLEIFKTRLTKWGYAFETASTGSEALEKLLQHAFDVVITDLMMPSVDGMEVLENVKNNSPQTDVIIISAYATVKNAVVAMQKGAADYLQKPINFDELALRLQKLALVRSLKRSTGDLREALDVTERNAASTIHMLEDMVLHLQGHCAEAERILCDESMGMQMRIALALPLLSQARKDGINL